jgi:hypothetical protein
MISFCFFFDQIVFPLSLSRAPPSLTPVHAWTIPSTSAPIQRTASIRCGDRRTPTASRSRRPEPRFEDDDDKDAKHRSTARCDAIDALVCRRTKRVETKRNEKSVRRFSSEDTFRITTQKITKGWVGVELLLFLHHCFTSVDERVRARIRRRRGASMNALRVFSLSFLLVPFRLVMFVSYRSSRLCWDSFT